MQLHTHTMQQTHTHKAVVGCIETKELLSRRRQSDYIARPPAPLLSCKSNTLGWNTIPSYNIQFTDVPNYHSTFVSKPLWYRTFKKIDFSLIWNLHRMCQTIHSSNCANFMKKISGWFLLQVKINYIMLNEWDYKTLFNANLDPFNRLTWIKKKLTIFFSENIQMVFLDPIAISHQILS